MSTHIRIEEFRPENETIQAYLERVELYFLASGTKEEAKVPLFLTIVGRENYTLLRDLLAPQKPSAQTLEGLFSTLVSHFEPKKVVIAERFHFHKRNQGPTETIAEYIAELRHLATHCKFGDYLNEALRDRLVCGLRNEETQCKLLAEDGLTLEQASKTASTLEMAGSQAQQLKTKEVAVKQVEATYAADKGSNTSNSCYRCGSTTHIASSCYHQDTVCRACNKRGHLARVCRSSTRNKSTRTKGRSSNYIAGAGDQDDAEDELRLPIFTMGGANIHPFLVAVKFNEKHLQMEVDTGAAMSVISRRTYRRLFSEIKLQKPTVHLKTYTGEEIRLVGQITASVTYGEQTRILSLIVVEGDGPSLLGRDWLSALQLKWKTIARATVESAQKELAEMMDKHKEIFAEELGTIRKFQAKLRVKDGATPRFHRPRPVPFALKEVVSKELDRLEAAGIIESVNYSEWAAPIVPVPKGDGKIRLCGDYKVTVNPVLAVDQHPLPKPEDLFTALTGGRRFTKLDLSQAYLQMELEKDSRTFATINTHQGLYQFTRVPFGIASAPAMFQKMMDTILQGLPGVICYIDDILVTGSTDEEHLKRLGEVFKRLEYHGIRLKRSKCFFLQESVEYLGHLIDSKGVRPTSAKVNAIVNAPRPKTQQELKSFLGMLNYYGKFIASLSTLLQPLNQLLQANRKWRWSDDCEKAFTEAKEKLAAAPVLTHYNPELPLRLAGDASSYGIGAVLSHVLPDGTEHPIAYASRTLTSSERNYAQLEKEALSLVFGVKKFHSYLYGRKFLLYTDHKPLTTIFGPKQGIPPLAAARLQRWALLLSAYDYSIEFKPTGRHANADVFSRLPVISKDSAATCEATIFNIKQMEALPVTTAKLRSATKYDKILCKVLRYTRTGWPSVPPAECLRPYWNRHNELSVEDDCLLWGNRVIVPRRLQQEVLNELHQSHPGVVRMKALSRSYFWWPGLDQDIESRVKSCMECQSHQSTPPVAPLHPWSWPSHPWDRIHIDFAGPFMGKMYLIIVDAHSKWPEVIEMCNTTAISTIRELRKLFAAHGIPRQLVSDNGPQFIAAEFKAFTEGNGIKHIRSAPYHPSSNGLAERFVQTFKQSMKAGERRGPPMSERLSNFLLTYRVTPHSTTGQPPCELFLNRTLRTRFDLIRPDLEKKVVDKQEQQKKHHDQHARGRKFSVNQEVMARNYGRGNKWMPGIVKQQNGPVSYTVLVDGMYWKRHVDQLRDRSTEAPEEEVPESQPTASEGDNETADNSQLPAATTELPPPPRDDGDTPVVTPAPVHRYPQRERREPPRFY